MATYIIPATKSLCRTVEVLAPMISSLVNHEMFEIGFALFSSSCFGALNSFAAASVSMRMRYKGQPVTPP